MAKLKEIIGEELFKQLLEDKQKEFKDKDFEDVSGGAFIPKQRFDQVNEQAKEYKKQLGERDKQLNDLQGKAKDNEELNKEIETLKATNQKVTQEYESKLNQINFDTKFEKALGAYKPKNPKALKALLNMEDVKLDGETFLGLEEQIKTLKESDAYLFAEETPGGTGNLGGGASSLFDTDPQGGSLGQRLAKEKAEAAKATETQNKFFA